MSSAAPRSRTAETYLASFSASGALVTSALVALLIVIAVVTFDAWPGLSLPGGGSGAVENTAGESSAVPDSPGGPGGPGAAAASRRAEARGASDGGARGSGREGVAVLNQDSTSTSPSVPGGGDDRTTGVGGGGGGGGGGGSSLDQTIRDTVSGVGNTVNNTTGGAQQTVNDTVGGAQNTVDNTLNGLGGN